MRWKFQAYRFAPNFRLRNFRSSIFFLTLSTSVVFAVIGRRMSFGMHPLRISVLLFNMYQIRVHVAGTECYLVPIEVKQLQQKQTKMHRR